MKQKFSMQSIPARLRTRKGFRSYCEGGFFNLRVSIGLLVFVAAVFLALFVTASPSNSGGGQSRMHSSESKAPRSVLGGQSTVGAFARATPQGVFIENRTA